MSIQSSLADSVFLGSHESSASAVIPLPRISLIIKLTTIILVGVALLIVSNLALARTGAISDIVSPPLPYLPGNSLPQLPKDTACVEHGYLYQSCVIQLSGQTIYVTYDPHSRMIVHTGLKTNESKIGDLIVAWGLPSGFNQYDTSIFVYWGTRSAVLYTHSFRPESRVEFIQYDLEEQTASAWRGFRNNQSASFANQS